MGEERRRREREREREGFMVVVVVSGGCWDGNRRLGGGKEGEKSREKGNDEDLNDGQMKG